MPPRNAPSGAADALLFCKQFVNDILVSSGPFSGQKYPPHHEKISKIDPRSQYSYMKDDSSQERSPVACVACDLREGGSTGNNQSISDSEKLTPRVIAKTFRSGHMRYNFPAKSP